jgi:hypothetical protein
MSTLADNAQFTITHLPGDSPIAVVAFAGISAGLGGLQIEEFRKSLAGLTHSAYFVIEKTPRWYNGTFASIGAALRDFLARDGAREIVTLGNSMGGFGAIAFAAHLPGCTRAVAFGPQSSVHPYLVPFEDRWMELRRPIGAWEIPDAVSQLSPEVAYTVIIGADEPRDVQHAARLAAASSQVRVLQVQGCGHEVGAAIKAQGAIVPLLDELISGGDAGRARDLLNDVCLQNE